MKDEQVSRRQPLTLPENPSTRIIEVEGMTLVEMPGYVEFPPIEHHPYRLTLASYSFLWPELQRETSPVAAD